MTMELRNLEEQTPRERLRAFRRTLRKRRKLIVWVTVLILVAIIAATAMMTPKYEAKASLYIRLEQQPVDLVNIAGTKSTQVSPVSPMAILNSYVETLKSRTTAEQVVREFKLDSRPLSNALRDRIKRGVVSSIYWVLGSISQKMAGSSAQNGGANGDKFRDTVDDLKSMISAEIDEDTELVLLTVLYEDRHLSQKICQRMIEILKERSVQMSRADSSAAYEAALFELPEAEERLAEADHALSEFKRRQGIVALTDEQRVRVEQLSNLEMQHNQARASLDETQARLEVVQRDIQEHDQPIVLTTVLAENPSVRQAKSDLYEREQQLVALLQTHTEEHPDVIRVKSQVESAREKLKQEVERVAQSETRGLPPERAPLVQTLIGLASDRMGLEAKEQAIAGQLTKFRADLSALPAKERRLEELARDQRVQAQFYTNLAQRAEELRMASQSGSPPVSMATIDPPRLPKGVSDIASPPYLIVLLLGPILSLIIGLTSAFVAEYFDDTLGSEEEVESRLLLPVLASIPRLREADRRAAGHGGLVTGNGDER